MRLPKSLAIRIGAVAATAAIAVTGATSAASASIVTVAVVHRIPTHLTISNTKPTVHLNQTVAVVNGHLTAGRFDLRGVRVGLLRQGAKGHWYVVQTELTRPFGHVLFLVHIGKAAVKFRLVYLGSKNFAPSVSRADVIAPA
jgi:hypothetical protein